MSGKYLTTAQFLNHISSWAKGVEYEITMLKKENSILTKKLVGNTGTIKRNPKPKRGVKKTSRGSSRKNVASGVTD